MFIIKMIQNRQELKEYIRADKEANGISHYLLKLIYGNDNARVFRYLKCLRHFEYALNNNYLIKMWYRLRVRRLGLRYNILIFPNTVGKGLYIPHLQGGGIIINCHSMGDNCIVGPGVVIGNKGPQENVPTIGDRVEFTTGCKVVGKVKIGDDSIVAPNSVVIADVPRNAIVSGVPAKIIRIKDTAL